MKQIVSILFVATMLVGLTSCDVLKTLPTNTTGGLFSLNGNWRLSSTSEGTALVGTTITVYPVTGDGTVTTLNNNSYCLRSSDVLWKDIKSNSGSFSVNYLVNACNSGTVYKPAMLTVITNDEVRLSGQTASGAVLTQTWMRVAK